MKEALEGPMNQALTVVREQKQAHLDETGWREARDKAWLWVAVTPQVSVFQIASSRGAGVAKKLLREKWSGWTASDRWSAYGWVKSERRQLCWSHLLRDFQGFVNRGGEGRRLGEKLLRRCQQWFGWWHRVKGKSLQRATFQGRMRGMKGEVLRLLNEAAQCSSERMAGMAREILKLKQALFTFVDVEGLEPTNNAAERALRPAVLWRKGCWGTHSAEGSRFVERMLTMTASLKQQGRHVLEYLTVCCEARLHGQPSPSLLLASAVPSLPLAS